jgi:hypothetical protein
MFIKIKDAIININELECAYVSGSTLYFKVKSSEHLLFVGYKTEQEAVSALDNIYADIPSSSKKSGS